MSKLRIIINILYADEVFEAPSFFCDDPFDTEEANHDKDNPKDLNGRKVH
tara:strand:- start:276 stop:425 length:150 start_codon:yes stop_codon:yes gene_type:complete